MYTFQLLSALLLAVSFTPITTAASVCTSAARLAGARQVPYAYNLKEPGASAAAFGQVPFAPDCVITVYPNGLPGVITAIDGPTSRAFAINSRQAFSDVTGEYTDYENGTTIIHTVVVRYQNLPSLVMHFVDL